MSLAEVFNTLGQTVIPQIGAAVFPDLMDVMNETKVVGSGGGQVKSASPVDYSDVPVFYKPMTIESRVIVGDKAVSLNEYILTFPTHHDGSRIEIDVKNHRLKVLERGNEPEKIFRIKSVRDFSGVKFECVATKEN